MAIDTDIVARKYLAPATGATISVDIPATDKTTIKVYLSEVGDVAVQDTDYTVALNTSTYEDFTITPTASLRTKLDALVTAGGTDFIVVRRTLGYLSDMTAELAFFRQKIAQEFDKTIMRFQQIAEKIGRCISRSENDTGATGSLVLPFSGSLANKVLVFDADENLTVSVDDYDDQAANAAASAAAALVSQNAAASSASAASASEGNAHTSELNAAASAAAAALNVVSAAMGPVCSAATLAAGRTALDVYNKSEVDTPLALKAPLSSPTFTGTVTAPTINTTTITPTTIAGSANFSGVPTMTSAPSAGDTTNKLATMANFAQGANGSALVLIGTATASSSSSISFTNIPQTYDYYLLRFSNLIPTSGASGGQLYITISEDNGSTWRAASYNTQWNVAYSTIAEVNRISGGTAGIQILGNNVASLAGISGEALMTALGSSSTYKNFNIRCSAYADASYNLTVSSITGVYTGDTGAINGLKLAFASGTIASGKVSLFGVRSA